jgi:hypothetical protein
MTTEPNPTSSDGSACPQCGCVEIRVYENEIPLCPHCSAVLGTDPTPSTTWLTQWPRDQRGGIGQRFHAAVRSGCLTPEAMVDDVIARIRRALQWTMDFPRRQLLGQVLNSLLDDRKAAKGLTQEASQHQEDETLTYEQTLWEIACTKLTELRTVLEDIEESERQRGLSQ